MHPFCVSHDYPTLYRVFWREQVENGETVRTGPFKPDNNVWITRDPNRLSTKSLQHRRQWIYRELLRVWAQSPEMHIAEV